MIERLAQESGAPTSGSWWADFLLLAAPLAAITVAWIGGRYALRTSRKSPYDRLDHLLKLRNDWPSELAGTDTLDRSIAHALAEVRYIEGIVAHPAPSGAAQAADTWFFLADRRRARIRLATSAFISVAVASMMTVLIYQKQATEAPLSDDALTYWTVGVTLWTIVSFLLMCPRPQDAFKRLRT
ncbi:hypothetical protein IU433_14245 [Nocardia puris]|uniref:hypothetical protein n=1 Tax=Nocardia puris TaxID=208602 RepID=UPI0018941445|nr:hypothetical protein [Nocardia puris]MBF6460198.1 hypothetical protein [Nocardia puris]